MNLIKKGRMIKNLSFCLFCKLEKKAERNKMKLKRKIRSRQKKGGIFYE